MSREAAAIDFCPKCLDIGRLNPFWPKGSVRREFVMVHGERDYKWGRSIKESERVTARDRCYLTLAWQRQWAAQRLGLEEQGGKEQSNLLSYFLS